MRPTILYYSIFFNSAILLNPFVKEMDAVSPRKMADCTPISLWSPNPSTGERGTAVKFNSNRKDSIVYAAGKSIFIKNIDTLNSITYTAHIAPTTVAKFSPSGFYVASADSTGLVKVWDVAGTDQILKVEVKAIGGRVNDLAWDSDNGGKRVIAVGEGRERFGHAFSIDGGNSVGEIVGHSKSIRAVAIRSSRPFRAITASDDTSVAFFNGTPYKFSKIIRNHTKFVQAVDYAPDGSGFLSAGSDYKIFVYDGSTGDTVSELGTNSSSDKHTGSIYSAVWSGLNHSTLASFSADGTVKMWDASVQKLTRTWVLASSPTPEQQQVGGTWLEGNRFVSLAYNGDLTVIDDRQPEPIKKVHACRNGTITAAKCPLKSGVYAADYSGRILHYSDVGACEPLQLDSSVNIIGMSASKSKLFSIMMDDTVREIDPAQVSASAHQSIPLSEQPKSISSRLNDNVALVATSNQVRLIESGNSLVTLPLEYSATTCALSHNFAAIGAEDGKVSIYNVTEKSLKHLKTLSNTSSITSLAISPDEKLIAVGEATGKILVYELSGDYRSVISSQWCWHTARIWSLSWRECSSFLASSSLDTNIYIWSLAKPNKKLSIKNAHVGGTTQVVWQNGTCLLSCGKDGALRRYSINLESLK
ncbi:hypothetical protein O181_047873 [Austropuccinia psidii MF-1]|uniref:Anaphase-promoting complex subunit 4-like WD40 domain-containing protein n=1 Tax=Austropuccinia psidii MF-1 TaxID=1389203 RepID=A0A9Q3DUR0_9BASI|nr:hypothetical protein [Austropuccinia psidii MF-1]